MIHNFQLIIVFTVFLSEISFAEFIPVKNPSCRVKIQFCEDYKGKELVLDTLASSIKSVLENNVNNNIVTIMKQPKNCSFLPQNEGDDVQIVLYSRPSDSSIKSIDFKCFKLILPTTNTQQVKLSDLKDQFNPDDLVLHDDPKNGGICVYIDYTALRLIFKHQEIIQRCQTIPTADARPPTTIRQVTSGSGGASPGNGMRPSKK